MTATAEETALLAAKRARVEVREVDDVREMDLIDRLFARTWGGDEQDAVSVNLMKALAHAGHYVVGAWRDRALVGATVGFVWGPPDPRRLHSHIAGVAPELQGAGIGAALKLHQAAWAISRGITAVTWTFDPLIRRNAWFNLMKLGARAASYHADFYGPMNDGINSGASDRCLATWDLSSGVPEPRPPGTVDGATVVLQEGPDGWPEIVGESQGRTLACQIPRDVISFRQNDPLLGQEWRLALRSTMGRAMQEGYEATTMTRDGHYLLEVSGD